jgi:hypothetical protein
MLAKLYKTEKENYVLVDPTKGTYDDGYMLGTSRESQYNKLSIKNCQAIERGYDLDELALEFCYTGNGVRDKFQPVFRGVFKDGFRKALEILGDKKFSEEDIEKAIEFGHKSYHSWKDRNDEKFIQSLQQKEWEVEIEMETIWVGQCNCPCHSDGVTIMHFMACCHPKMVESPKLDADGCLILRRMSPDSSN